MASELDVPTGALSIARLEMMALDAVAEGTRIIKAASGQPTTVRMKSSPTDPVTTLDLEVERTIRSLLARWTPGASFLGEEQGGTIGPSALGWILDPIDGTVNLTYDLPCIGVSLAATRGGVVVAGAVADPSRGELFSAGAGLGARRDGFPIAISAVSELSNALVATGFGYTSDARELEAAVVSRVLPAARDVRCFGSSALQLCWVACGRLDAFYQRRMKRWDYAAGALIASESGALVEPPTVHNGELMLASNRSLFEPLMRLVR